MNNKICKVANKYNCINSVEEKYYYRKRYELVDWLGNVRVVINDKKVPVNSGNTTVSYLAELENVYDYYSFGALINERTYNYSNRDYRFGFNGKQKDDEVYGYGNFQDYGARMYDTRLGRFVSADPLIVKERKYAWLSSYQFASNTPLQAIDLDGKEAFFIHGTWSNPGTWSDASRNIISEATGNKTQVSFAWSGYNSAVARHQAAIELVNKIYTERKADEPLVLIGHSHGGNVAIEAANIIKKMGGKVDMLITINTPVREDYQPMEGAVDKHYNVYNEGDRVQIRGGNDINEPSGYEFVLGGKEIIEKPILYEGKYLGTGEMGKSEREFKGAVNINYSEKSYTGHHGHEFKNVKKWIDKIIRNENDKNNKR